MTFFDPPVDDAGPTAATEVTEVVEGTRPDGVPGPGGAREPDDGPPADDEEEASREVGAPMPVPLGAVISDVEGRRPRILIITGMSGAGRSTASNAVEDLGWFVIDNLPPTLIERVAELAFAPGSSVTKLGLVADVRGREFFAALVDTIRELRRSEADVRVLYLEADDEVLVRRFEETRRRHPASGDRGVLAGIRAEREQLRELRGLADLIVDTSELNVHELRDRVLDAVDDPGAARLHIDVVSFGFKHGSPREADLVFDVRFLPNPHWVDGLREHDGRDAKVRDYVFGQPMTAPFVSALEALLDVAVPGYVTEGKRYLTIAIGCTGGKHRSVALSNHVADYLEQTFDLPVSVNHRDLGAE